MIKNANNYVTRKSLKSIIILLVITAMSIHFVLLVYQLKMLRTNFKRNFRKYNK